MQTCPICDFTSDVPWQFDGSSKSEISVKYGVDCPHLFCLECCKKMRRENVINCPVCGKDKSCAFLFTHYPGVESDTYVNGNVKIKEPHTAWSVSQEEMKEFRRQFSRLLNGVLDR